MQEITIYIWRWNTKVEHAWGWVGIFIGNIGNVLAEGENGGRVQLKNTRENSKISEVLKFSISKEETMTLRQTKWRKI